MTNDFLNPLSEIEPHFYTWRNLIEDWHYKLCLRQLQQLGNTNLQETIDYSSRSNSVESSARKRSKVTKQI